MAEQSRRASLVYAARGVGSRGASIAAAFAMTWIAAHALPRDLAGRFFVSTAVLLGIATVVRFGLESLLVKLAAADPDLARPLARPSYIATLALGAVGTLVGLAFLLFYIHGVAWWALLLFASSVITTNLALVSGALLRGVGRVTAGSVAELGSLPALTFVALAALHFTHPPLHLGHAVLAYGLAGWATAAWSAPLAWRTLRAESHAQPPTSITELFRDHGTALRQFMITALGYYLFARVPLMVLGGQPEQGANFQAASTLANLVATIPAIQISYLSPRFAHLFHHGELDALNRLIRRSTITGSVVAGFLALPLIVLPHLVLQIFKPDYASAWLTLLILAAATALQVLLGPVQGLLVTCGFERQAARITLIMLGAGTILMLLVLPWGAPAVALANSVANLAYVATGAVLLHRSAGIISPLGPSLRRGTRSSSSAAPGAGR